MKTETISMVIYLLGGLLAYLGLYRLFRRRKTAVDVFKQSMHGLATLEGALVGIFLWPLVILLFVIVLADRLWVEKARRRRALALDDEAKRKTRYSDMSLEEMLVVQRRILKAARDSERRE